MKTARQAPAILERGELLRRLDRALNQGNVLLSAPAGYGKSVTLRSLNARRPLSYYVPITAEDLDLVRLQSRLEPHIRGGVTLLLDDMHHLRDVPEIRSWLVQMMLEEEPRWLMAGRSLPFSESDLLPLHDLTRIDETFLQFTPTESRMLLGDDERADRWHRRLNGWPIALSLLSRLGEKEPTELRTEKYLFPYLARAVFDQLPADLNHFLTVTALPRSFNLDLATLLLGDGKDAERLLGEIERRNLYLQPDTRPGWFRYHDLVRRYLIQKAGSLLEPLSRRVVEWFVEQGEPGQAVEQALDTGLIPEAEELVLSFKLDYFHRGRSYLTYRRWVGALSEPFVAEHPMLLIRLSNGLSQEVDYLEEAREQSQRAVAYARNLGESGTELLGRTNLALIHYREGEFEKARDGVDEILTDPRCVDYPRAFALRVATLIRGDMADYHTLPALISEAVNLTQSLGLKNEPAMNLANRAWLYETPLGNFARAESILDEVLSHFANLPGWQGQYLIYRCELEASRADWPALRSTLQRLGEVVSGLDSPELFVQLWKPHYLAILHLLDGEQKRFQETLADYATIANRSALNRLCVAWLACWHLRRRGELSAVVIRAEIALAETVAAPRQRALLALERDIAHAYLFLLGDLENFDPSQEVKSFIPRRSRPFLIRLRALLAVVCEPTARRQSRRHRKAVLRHLSQSGYEGFLERRDPELARRFWLLGLDGDEREWIVVKQALVNLGDPVLLLPFLDHASIRVRSRVAEVLGDIGDERALPHLGKVKGKAMKVSRTAVVRIEAADPPRLRICLMGRFSLQRGNDPIEEAVWTRPIVLRLFVYFVLRRGHPIPREEILETFWPDLEPARAANSFRTVYSSLRRVLEPYMRAKGPNRYIESGAETYAFDPQNRSWIDSHSLLEQIHQAETNPSGAEQYEALAAALDGYADLLPHFPYVDWIDEPRRFLRDRYVDGALLLARRWFEAGDYDRTIRWARRGIDQAPWLESGYRILMRSYARQGQRGRALQIYDEARSALEEHMAVQPDPRTHWLYTRLRDGQRV